MTIKPTALSELLHDASLITGLWDADTRTLSFRLDCLRRAVDGSELADRSVELRVTDVVAIAVSYDTSNPELRPSELEVPDGLRIDVNRLDSIPESPVDWVSLDSQLDAETVTLAARTDWQHGSAASARTGQTRLCIQLSGGTPSIPISIWAAGGALAIDSSDGPLTVGDWAEQNRAWWRSWEERWDAGGSGESAAPREEDAFIPVRSDPPPAMKYAPPAEPGFEIDVTDAPEELLAPLRDWFEGLIGRDLERRARAERNPDVSLEEQVKSLSRSSLPELLGRWGYARAIEDWWTEGRRAYVRVRGIEHSMPIEELAAENEETVWDFALREREGRWVIAAYTQGWPRHGSAPAIADSAKPWLARWR